MTKPIPIRNHDLSSKILTIRKKYGFNYSGSICIGKIAVGLTYCAFSPGHLFVYSRGVDLGHETYKSSIHVVPFGKGGQTRELVRDIHLEISAPGIKWIDEMNALVFASGMGRVGPKVLDLQSGGITDFHTPDWVWYINLSAIRYVPDLKAVCVVDTFAHVMDRYTLEGQFVRRYEFPSHMQFPVQILPMDDNRLLISFLQNGPLRRRRMYKKTFLSPPLYVALLDLDSGECSYVDCEPEVPFSFLEKCANRFVWGLSGKIIWKLSPGLQTIFKLDLHRKLETVMHDQGQSKNSDNRIIISGMEVKGNRLYVYETGCYHKAFIFDV